MPTYERVTERELSRVLDATSAETTDKQQHSIERLVLTV